MADLAYRESGEDKAGEPPLLLMHGLFGSSENLGGIARELAKELHLYSIDLPNHGRSPHSTVCSLSSMAESVTAWMDKRSLDKVSILGHSLGGKVAMEIALRCPDRVNRLCVLDIAPVKYQARHDQVFAGLLAIDLDSTENRAQAEAILAEFVKEPPVRSFLLKNLVKVEGKLQWRMNLLALREGYVSLIDQNARGRFDGEVCFIKGGDSDYITEAHRQDITERFPKAKLKIIPETGHWLHAEKPLLVAKAVLREFKSEA